MEGNVRMNQPNLINLDRFKKKVRNLTKPSITLTVQEAKALDADLDALMQYTVILQAKIIAQGSVGEVTNIEVSGGDFF